MTKLYLCVLIVPDDGGLFFFDIRSLRLVHVAFHDEAHLVNPLKVGNFDERVPVSRRLFLARPSPEEAILGRKSQLRRPNVVPLVHERFRFAGNYEDNIVGIVRDGVEGLERFLRRLTDAIFGLHGYDTLLIDDYEPLLAARVTVLEHLRL